MADKQGIDFIDALQLMFIGLKITGNIDWNWWLVLSPIIFIILFGMALGLIQMMFYEES